MNDLILQILPIIEQVAKHSTRNRDQQHEIRQELILKCYDNSAKIQQGINQGRNPANLIYVYARNLRLDQIKKVKPVIMQIPDRPTPETEQADYDNVKTHNELMDQIKGTDRMWIELYLECDLNKNEMHRRTGVCRETIDERLKYIFDKWKQLDIYLPQ